MSDSVFVMRAPSTPPSVERFLQGVPAEGRCFVLRMFLGAAREVDATTDTVICEMQQLFADMRSGKERGRLSSYVTHQVGFAVYRQFIDAPQRLRDLANYALYTVAYERALEEQRGCANG